MKTIIIFFTILINSTFAFAHNMPEEVKKEKIAAAILGSRDFPVSISKESFESISKKQFSLDTLEGFFYLDKLIDLAMQSHDEDELHLYFKSIKGMNYYLNCTVITLENEIKPESINGKYRYNYSLNVHNCELTNQDTGVSQYLKSSEAVSDEKEFYTVVPRFKAGRRHLLPVSVWIQENQY